MRSPCEITQEPSRLAGLVQLWQTNDHDVWIRLQGKSMLPTIPPGSLLRLRCTSGVPHIGDIIAYRNGGSLAVHRLIRTVEEPSSGQVVLICKGDGNAHLDPPVTVDRVVGVVLQVRRPTVLARSLSYIMAAARYVPGLLPLRRAIRRATASRLVARP